jgi:hypothetical protein
MPNTAMRGKAIFSQNRLTTFSSSARVKHPAAMNAAFVDQC